MLATDHISKVVVIDDRVTNRNILTRLAASVEEGLQVMAFANAVDGLAWMCETTPDLVITDFKMPEMDGAELIRRLRAVPECRDVPVVVVTVYEDRSYCYKALEAGATDFLLSPVDHLEFRARARNLLMLRKQQRLLEIRAQDLEKALSDGAVSGDDTTPERSRTVGQLLDSIPAMVSCVDTQGRVLLANRTHRSQWGLEPSSVLGCSLNEAHDEDYATRHDVLNAKVLETGRPLPAAEQEIVTRDGDQRFLLTQKSPVIDGAGRVSQVVTVSLDVTEWREAEERSRHEAQHDPLTGLPNRDLFLHRLAQEIAQARRANQMVALILLDLDRFKGVNDVHGHAHGDKLLQAVAARLKSRLRETDTIARLGGDEFAVLQTSLKRPDDAGELTRRLIEAFSEPYLIDGHEAHSSASFGITLFPADGNASEQLLKNAEMAMYRAKASGRDAFRFFAAEMNLHARRMAMLERELRQALAAEQLTVFYQPQFEADTGRIVGVEALLRWRHPSRGIIRPGEFIALAEDVGLIAPLSSWVLREACRQHRQWQEGGLQGIRLSVNLSPVQFRERGVELLVEQMLRESDLDPHLLDIELTENAVMENTDAAMASLHYLHQLGVTFSLDDFGTGYSSLSYVKRLPVQRLKIDQGFIHALEHSSNDEAIVRAIINLGHSLGLRVVAEGVETEAQLSRVQELGCDEIQGDLMSPPLPAAELEARIVSEMWRRTA